MHFRADWSFDVETAMIALSRYQGKKVGVFGLGKAGDATVAALVAGDAEVFAWDDGEASRKALSGKFGNAVQLSAFAEWPWEQLSFVCISPGVPFTHPKPHDVISLAEQNKCPVLGDIELLYQHQPEATYVAITGTNGKSTTTTLIAHILNEAGKQVQVGGNLGTPVLAFDALSRGGVYVIETSSYQLDLLRSTRFNVAAFLNITPDHLDRHGDMDGYVAAKMHIFDRQQPGDVAVVAVEDEYTRKVSATLKARSAQKLVEVTATETLHGIDLRNIPTLTGRHNWQNAAVAYAVAAACGVSHDVIARAMQSFAGLAHRLEMISTVCGVRFINDSKATNADATANALAPFKNIYWILGGKPKAGGIESLSAYFPQVSHAFLIGEAADQFAVTFGDKVKYTLCGTLDKAVEKAAAMAFAEQKKNAVVLLSPACASFDQFKNFEERGDAFRALVLNLDQQMKHSHAS